VPAITADFSHLRMLGHVFVVGDAKDLAQIVRDVTGYGWSHRPEIGILYFRRLRISLLNLTTFLLILLCADTLLGFYEFVQQRSDWKKIEKMVDKAMYNLRFAWFAEAEHV
jgi:recyclin-1